MLPGHAPSLRLFIMRRHPTLTLALLALLASPALAQVERSHDAHVHGRSQIDLVYDAGTLQLELSAPGMDLAGFEHAPTNDAERALIATTMDTLRNSASWLDVEPDGVCSMTSTEASARGFEPGHEGDDHGHVHHDPVEKAGDPAHPPHTHDGDTGHAAFHVKLTATCSEAPVALRIRLHDRFPALDVVRVDLITETGQNRIELTQGQSRVSLSE